jgi:hypothetical protein
MVRPDFFGDASAVFLILIVTNFEYRELTSPPLGEFERK